MTEILGEVIFLKCKYCGGTTGTLLRIRNEKGEKKIPCEYTHKRCIPVKEEKLPSII